MSERARGKKLELALSGYRGMKAVTEASCVSTVVGQRQDFLGMGVELTEIDRDFLKTILPKKTIRRCGPKKKR